MAISTIPLASAYPSPDLPAAQFAIMIAIPVSLLVVWLALVFLAARPGSERTRLSRQPQAPPPGGIPAVAAPDAADENVTGTEPQLIRSGRLCGRHRPPDAGRAAG
jgi:hypothetical protein